MSTIQPLYKNLSKLLKNEKFSIDDSDSAYRNAPRFQQFLTRTGLPFRAYKDFGPEAQEERTELLLQLANRIWSPDRLNEAQR